MTNALRETLLSFGGSVATELVELSSAHRNELVASVVRPDSAQENDPNGGNGSAAAAPSHPIQLEPKNHGRARNARKESSDSGGSRDLAARSPHVGPAPPPVPLPPPANRPLAPTAFPPPIANQRPPAPAPAATAVPAPAPAPPPPPPPNRGNANVSFVLQPMMPPLFAPTPRLPVAPPHGFPPHAYFAEYATGPWHFACDGYDRHHGNVNLNFNLPPKNLVVNGRAGSVECKAYSRGGAGGGAGGGGGGGGGGTGEEGYGTGHAGAPPPGCWIKPTIFYDGFWTEQKVKKWVAEQVEKQFPEDGSFQPPCSGGGGGGGTTGPA